LWICRRRNKANPRSSASQHELGYPISLSAIFTAPEVE
jgi:hypothetical protein